jgi:hypothetical protein
MNNYNPDYPSCNGGSFLQHTYNTPNNASIEAMYFNSGIGFVPNQQFDSRRNMGLNPNGIAPTNPFNTNHNMNTVMGGGYPSQPQQEQSVMPFSIYPPGVPQQQQTPTLNSLVDSRRTATAVNNNTIGSNPWANQPQPQNIMNQQQQMFSTPSPFVNQYGYTGQPTQYMYDTSILNNCGSLGKREGYWDNIYSQPNVINQPVIDWNNQQQQQQYGYCGGMPMPQYPAVNISWREQAERNWGVK